MMLCNTFSQKWSLIRPPNNQRWLRLVFHLDKFVLAFGIAPAIPQTQIMHSSSKIWIFNVIMSIQRPRKKRNSLWRKYKTRASFTATDDDDKITFHLGWLRRINITTNHILLNNTEEIDLFIFTTKETIVLDLKKQCVKWWFVKFVCLEKLNHNLFNKTYVNQQKSSVGD